jgi:hypothetical protein
MKIKPFNQSGAWVSSYIVCYRNAWLNYADYSRELKNLEQLESEIRNDSVEDDKDILESYILWKTGNITSEAHRFADSAIIFCALTIEGFLNDYGFRRIGPNLYNELLERKSASKKYQLIWKICFDEEIKNDDQTLNSIKKIFKARNILVHPKTKYLNIENPVFNPHPSELGVIEYLEGMDLILQRFFDKDNTIPKQFFAKEYDAIE